MKIQRVPRGLNDLLSIIGGQTPTELETKTRLSLESIQLYGTTQLQFGFANNAALAEGGLGVQLTLSATNWTVLFGAHGTFVKTATATALRGAVTLTRRTAAPIVLFTQELGPFGATETGSALVGGLLPYPLICPPGTIVASLLSILGTDATANVSISAEFGVLG